MPLRRRLSANAYFEGIRNGNRAILSQAITLIESRLESDKSLVAELLDLCVGYTDRGFRLGITGSPGVGKSTFIEAFGLFLVGMQQRVAVLAVDPSSTRTGGSILGDKTRMPLLSAAEQAFIRPSPSGGALGGVATSTAEAILLCQTAGFDYIIVETVGVGQSEVIVRDMTDFFLLLLQPGAGDELQGIKRGIMEMADGILITKADGTYLQAAKRTQADYRYALHLMPPSASKVPVRVELCSAKEHTGLNTVLEMLLTYRQGTQASGYWYQARQQQRLARFREELRAWAFEQFMRAPATMQLLPQLEKEVFLGKRSSLSALNELLQSTTSKI